MHTIEIMRGLDKFTTVKPDDNSSQTKQIMGDHFITLQFTLNHYAAFKIGDWCTIFGENYYLNTIPVEKKLASNLYTYSLKLDSYGKDLSKVQFLFLGSDNALRQPDFSLMGNAKTFMDLIIANANRFLGDWNLGEVIQSDYKNLSFTNLSCLEALGKIADAFGTEYFIENKTIYLSKKVKDTGNTFKLGKQRGLYELQRQPLNNAGIVTRLYVYGSDKNLPASYLIFSDRLRLPGGYASGLVSNLTCTVVDNGNGTSTFSFDFVTPTTPGIHAMTIQYSLTGQNDFHNSTGDYKAPRTLTIPTGTYDFKFRTEPDGLTTQIVTIGATAGPLLTTQPIPYIEKNTDKYGIIEYTQIFNDVYPHRTGKITAVNAANVYQFVDSTIDFNINNQLLPGTRPKIVFNTGQLSGYSFEIASFDNSTKEVTILKNKDEKALDIPSDLLKPAIGDEYVIVDINMPSTYISKAENELLIKATQFLDQISSPQYSYIIKTDPVVLKNRNITLNIGDLVWLVDNDLELDRKIRITQLTRNIVSEFLYDVQLSDVTVPGTISSIINVTQNTQQNVSDLQNQVDNNKILNGKVVGNLEFEQGVPILKDIESITDPTNYSPLYINNVTGKIVKKI